jgi:hypothetical protein
MYVSSRLFMLGGPQALLYQPSGNGMNGQASWLSFAAVCRSAMPFGLIFLGAAEGTGGTNLAARSIGISDGSGRE